MDANLRLLISKVKKEHNDDACDRTIYATSVYILSFFALLIMAKQYVGEPLQCWLPAEYTANIHLKFYEMNFMHVLKGAWERYIENYCFVENTYYVASTDGGHFLLAPEHRFLRKNYEYYQWIPYILSIQALICFAPKLIFKILYSMSDLRVTDLVQLVYRESKKNFLRETGDDLSKSIAQKLIRRTQVKAQIAFNWYLTAIYIIMKIFLVAVTFTQLAIINYFIGSFDPFWGFSVVGELASGVDWRTNGFFPRVREFLQVLVQCVLMINMFAEKIFIFLWLWFFVLLVVSTLNLLFWLYRVFVMHSKERMVVDALKLYKVSPEKRENVSYFVTHYLKLDGVVVLRLIGSNSGFIQMADILYQLWNNYCEFVDQLSSSEFLSRQKQ